MATTGRSDGKGGLFSDAKLLEKWKMGLISYGWVDPTTFDLDGDGGYIFDDLVRPDAVTEHDVPTEDKEFGQALHEEEQAQGKKARPWSGRSQQSIGDVMLSSRTYDEEF